MGASQSPLTGRWSPSSAGNGWSEEGLPGCCRQQPLDGRLQAFQAGRFEPVSPSVYKIKWTGHGETTNGFLRRISPVETNVVTSFNMNNMKVDAIVWKSFAGKKYGFTLPTTSSCSWLVTISL